MRIRFGDVLVDALGFDEALRRVEQLVDRGEGGAVFTPNVDHVVIADRDPAFRSAYARASLALADGQPLVWASRLVGHRLPEKVSGSDLFLPLMHLAARRAFKVYLLGAGPGVASAAAGKLRDDLGVVVCGVDAPAIGLEPAPDEDEVVARIAAARPALLVVCLGAPKGERFIDRNRARLGAAVALSLGGTLDFYVGRVRRAPRWMRRGGLEWLYRLVQEPRRLARRYLMDDPRFLWLLARTLRAPEAERVVPASPDEGPPRTMGGAR